MGLDPNSAEAPWAAPYLSKRPTDPELVKDARRLLGITPHMVRDLGAAPWIGRVMLAWKTLPLGIDSETHDLTEFVCAQETGCCADRSSPSDYRSYDGSLTPLRSPKGSHSASAPPRVAPLEPDLKQPEPNLVLRAETSGKALVNMLLAPTIDRALAGQAPLSEWQFQPDPDGRFAGVVDVFGDGSLWAIWTPGHTAGSTAYLARTPHGPVLFVGDTSHTVWGWENDVGPGSFTADHAANLKSLAQLKALVADHPRIDVRLGHQWMPPAPVAFTR
jgi:hypothetical protein